MRSSEFDWTSTGLDLHLGSAVQLLSSRGLGWSNLGVARYLIDPGEMAETPTCYHVVAIASGTDITFGERADLRGRVLPYTKTPGTLTVVSDGLIRVVNPSIQTDLTVCALTPNFVQEVIAEQPSGVPDEIVAQIGVQDVAVADLMRLIEREVELRGPCGCLYIDHLAYALTLRLLKLGKKATEPKPAENALPRPRLRRVLERMEADICADLDLKTLAIMSGYSRNHFLRMFRAATGYTPHQYLLRLRLNRAQEMLKDKATRLIDVAMASGFSSHAHLSYCFRQVFGATPSEYRRNID